jgi:group II intron reverse transcriptase/maturase
MYLTAYNKIYANEGNMTKGSDSKTIDGMSLERIEKLIEKLKNESYQPMPSRRTYIPKKGGKMRPLGIPTFDDKLIQEVLRMILEAVYEGSFENISHGFRPNKSCHTALLQVQGKFTGTKWFIEGDIKGFFDNIDHNVIIKLLEKRINDNRFLRLIRKFLKAGYLENWTFHKTYSGTPQGGIISPILANIYLHELDCFMKEYTEKFNQGKKRQRTYEYRKIESTICNLRKKLKETQNETERKNLIKAIRELEKERSHTPTTDPMDENYKRIQYVRYADDFLIGVIGSKADCEKIKEDIRNFLFENLKLELSTEKTLITHAQSPAKFLGYDVYVRKCSLTKRNKNGSLVRNYGSRIVLAITTEKILAKLFE